MNKSKIHSINPAPLAIGRIKEIVRLGFKLSLSEESREKIGECRAYLDKTLEKGDKLFYGINTGFGSLCNIVISNQEVEQLQFNLIQSHAVGMGDVVPPEVVRILLLLKIKSLSSGYSGVRIELVERLLEFFNRDLLPVIYTLGSLGASGDLAPLAHLSLPLIGKGDVFFQGRRTNAAEALKLIDVPPLNLKSKEGLALLNGTQFSCAYAVWCVYKALELVELANLCGAMSLDAFNANKSPFERILHEIRPHPGQMRVAKIILGLLDKSELIDQPHKAIQDPYAFRCIPQVHGASVDALTYIEKVVLTEVNSVTDNPSIFPAEDQILSGGNFHGQPLALALDFLAIALAELGNISERRTYQLLTGAQGLPAYLVSKAGLHSGMMIAQYTAAAMVSQNKQFCTPASVDSIVSSNGQEDHVSMSANAATKAYQVVLNLERILAIEFMVAAQALEFRLPLRSSPGIMGIIENYRKVVPFLDEDRVLSEDVQKTIDFLPSVFNSI